MTIEGEGAAAPDTAVVETEVEAATPPAPEAKPAKKGTDFLDFSTLPPEVRSAVEPRFKHLYANLKDHERGRRELDALNRSLTGTVERLVEKFETLETGERQKQTTQELSAIKSQIKEAAERGDYEKVSSLTEKLVEVKAEAIKPKPAVAKPDPDATYLSSWAEERAADGTPARPWTQEGHPLRDEAVSLTYSALAHPNFKNNREAALAYVDEQMAKKTKPVRTAAPVLGSGQDVRPRTGDDLPRLSNEQKSVAEKLFSSMTAKDAHARYAKQLKLIGKAS